MTAEVDVALGVDTQLGEGLHWDTRRGLLWLVDIEGRRLLSWNAMSLDWSEWRMPQRLGWVIPVADSDDILLGLQSGIARARVSDPTALDWIASPFVGQRSLRLNDAKADVTGAVWFGSVNHDDESRSDGCLYRMDGDGAVTCHDDGYTVANGPAISPEGDWLLHTDSGRRTIYAFALDVGVGSVTSKRIWKKFADDEGYPDGMCFDSEGCVWVAHWGAACISRFARDGSLIRRIALPASRVSNVCFGGQQFDRLFVTSARIGTQGLRRDAEPLSGALFEVDARGVKGLPGLCGNSRLGRRPAAAPSL